MDALSLLIIVGALFLLSKHSGDQDEEELKKVKRFAAARNNGRKRWQKT